MSVNTNISAYPWLCSTMKKKYDYECENSDNGSSISKDESDNVDSYTSEAYGTYGLQMVYYKVSEHLKRDKIYGEDQLQVIERAFNVMMYTEQLPPNVRSYHIQGIWGEDVITCYVGIGAFNYWSTYGGEDRNTPKVYDSFIPRIGDIVYLPQNNTFYEIRDVKYFQEAFGLSSHTYTLTLKVYKDTKMTILNGSPTIPQEDPVWAVATKDFPEQYEINDPLKHNEILDYDELRKSKNVNHMDVIYNPNKEYEELEEYAKSIPYKFKGYMDEIGRISTETDEVIEGMDGLGDQFNELRTDTEQKVEELTTSANKIKADIKELDIDSTIAEYKSKE